MKTSDLFFKAPVWVFHERRWREAIFRRTFRLHDQERAYLALWPRGEATANPSDLRPRRPSLNGADIPKQTPFEQSNDPQIDIFTEVA